MCAIVGIIREKEKVNYEELKKMIEVMSYRDPDEEGYFLKKMLTLDIKD